METTLRAKCGVASIAIAVSMALGTAQSVAAPPNAPGEAPARIQHHRSQGLSISGPILVGPIESVAADGLAITVLGKTVSVGREGLDLLPAQYVAVFGRVETDGAISVEFVLDLGQVYAPGNSTVLIAGAISQKSRSKASTVVGGPDLQTIDIAAFDRWSLAKRNSMVLVLGTQSASGAPIDAQAIVSFGGPGTVELKDIGIGHLSGVSVRGHWASNLDESAGKGSGLSGLNQFGTITENEHLSLVKDIDGSGFTIQGVDGSGFSTQGVDGSGFTTQGVDGSGFTTQGVDGSGFTTQGVDGSGFTTQGVDGSGFTTQGVDGSGFTTQGVDGSGFTTQGVDGSGFTTQGVDGSGFTTQGVDGSGFTTQGVDGSGFTTQGVDGSGFTIQGVDGSGFTTQGVDGSGSPRLGR
jgi:hypothetical protein